MIKRTYTTKSECVKLFMEEDFSAFPASIVFENRDWYDSWEFEGKVDEECAEDGEEYGDVDVPMWGTWWIPRDSVNIRWIEEHREETMDCGFTLVYHEDELFALGVDGAGYSFLDAHFAPLYDAQGLKWHDSED